MADGMDCGGRGSAMAPRSRSIPEAILQAPATLPGPSDSPTTWLQLQQSQAMPRLATPSNGLFLAVPRSDLALRPDRSWRALVAALHHVGRRKRPPEASGWLHLRLLIIQFFFRVNVPGLVLAQLKAV